MRVIHVLRKPLSEGTVAVNVLKHGTGGINIDASRISTTDNLNGGAYAENASERHDGAENWRYKRGEQGNAGEYQPPTGRWPANVILQHLDGCQCGGVKKVRSPMRKPTGKPIYATEGSAVEWNANNVRDTTTRGHADEDGKETLANWICVPDCPVRALDSQTADRLHLAGNVNNNGTGDGKDYTATSYHISYEGRADRDQSRKDTTTGASRFFKQVGGSGETP